MGIFDKFRVLGRVGRNKELIGRKGVEYFCYWGDESVLI